MIYWLRILRRTLHPHCRIITNYIPLILISRKKAELRRGIIFLWRIPGEAAMMMMMDESVVAGLEGANYEHFYKQQREQPTN